MTPQNNNFFRKLLKKKMYNLFRILREEIDFVCSYVKAGNK
jgi:hypothetical protein